MSFLNTAGFSVAYYLFTFFALEASFIVALGHWRRNLAVKAKRLAIAFGLLGLLWVLALIFFSMQQTSAPILLDVALATISMGFLAWAFSPYLTDRPVAGFLVLTLNTALAAILFVIATLSAANGVNGLNFVPVFLVWQIGLGLFWITAMVRPFRDSYLWALIAAVTLVSGGTVQLLLGGFDPQTSTAVFLRLSEMAAYAILVMAVYQEVVISIDLQTRAMRDQSDASREEIKGLINLFDATRSISAALDLTEVVDGATTGVAKMLEVDQVAIAMPEEDTPSRYKLVSVYNPYREGRGQDHIFPISNIQTMKHSAEYGRRIELNTGFNNQQYKLLYSMMGVHDRVGPLVFQPLVLGDKTIGMVVVGNAHSGRLFGPLDFELLDSVAQHISIAIANAKDYKRVVNRAQQLAWTLRNQEQEASRHRTALEAELKQSRESVAMMSQRLHEQESMARKSQKQLTEYQQHIRHLSLQYKTVYQKLEQVTEDREQLARSKAMYRKDMQELEKAEQAAKILKEKVQLLEIEARSAEEFREALKKAQQQNQTLIKALDMSQDKLQQLAAMQGGSPWLQSSEALASLSYGMVVSDTSGVVSRVNQMAAQLLQKSTALIQGKPLSTLNDSETWQAAAGKLSDITTLLFTTLTVEDRTLKATISPVADPKDGARNGYITIIYDATEEVENQRARDEFVASLAQELRTPMTSITGYVDLLLGESVGMIGDMQRKFLQRVKANIERMDNLLNDLIGIAAIDAGQLELNPTTLNMAEIIEDAIIGAKAQLTEKEIQLKLGLPQEMPPIQADAGCMQQVLTNLLGNAAKSTPAGGQVDVSAAVMQARSLAMVNAQSDDEKWLQIAVTDAGGGIAEADIQRVFERFYKADRPLIQGLGETGVGLSIAKHLVEAHNGKVWLETEMGKGTTFYFALPIQDYYNDPWAELDVPPLDLNSDFQD